MSVELHLPDLPEVPISVGLAPVAPGAPRQPRAPLHHRLRDLLSAYLPLLLMLLLALATWWLAKNSPQPVPAPGEAVLRTDPDYMMSGFALERFDAGGRLKLRIDGAQMHHFPASDRIEIDGVQLRALAPDGRQTLAHARRALATGDGSEVQLLGGAEVTSVDRAGQKLVMRGEFLHAFFVTERVTSHLPVQVLFGSTAVQAAGMTYDHPSGQLDLSGPLRTTLAPRGNGR